MIEGDTSLIVARNGEYYFLPISDNGIAFLIGLLDEVLLEGGIPNGIDFKANFTDFTLNAKAKDIWVEETAYERVTRHMNVNKIMNGNF